QQTAGVRRDRMQEDDLREQCRRFLGLFRQALRDGGAGADVEARAWDGVRGMLGELSRSRARQGFTPSETATLVFSLTQPLFTRLRRELERQPEALADETWTASALLDALGLYTTEVHQKGREEVIARQQQDMLELSTPVVQLWKGIVAIPL